MYGADVSATLISKVTDAVIEQVVEWQSRPLDAIQPVVYLDCIIVKILARQESDQQSNLPRFGRRPGRPQGIIGDVAIGE